MAEAPALERLLKRDRVITAGALALLCSLAWAYLLNGGGMGMSAWEMTRLTLFPHQETAAVMPGMPGMTAGAHGWSVLDFALSVAMWWMMMVAMMAPSAAPTILLYAQVHRHSVAQGRLQPKLAPTGAFAAGYLAIWLAFSVLAATLQGLLEKEGVISSTMLDSRSRWLSAGVLIAVGLYQLSPVKNACLSHCRSPASFLSRHWRPGPAGAVRLGALHGAYCVGCCWALMALLFVGGIMNLVWIAALTLTVCVEKLIPRGDLIGRAAGIAMIGWGIATLTL